MTLREMEKMHSKGSNRVKRQLTEWEKSFCKAVHLLVLISRIYKKLLVSRWGNELTVP